MVMVEVKKGRKENEPIIIFPCEDPNNQRKAKEDDIILQAWA